MAIHSSIFAWEAPWREEPDVLQSMGSQRVGHDSLNRSVCACIHTHTHTHTHSVLRDWIEMGEKKHLVADASSHECSNTKTVGQDLNFCQNFHLVQTASFKGLGSEALEMCLGNIRKL